MTPVNADLITIKPNSVTDETSTCIAFNSHSFWEQAGCQHGSVQLLKMRAMFPHQLKAMEKCPSNMTPLPHYLTCPPPRSASRKAPQVCVPGLQGPSLTSWDDSRNECWAKLAQFFPHMPSLSMRSCSLLQCCVVFLSLSFSTLASSVMVTCLVPLNSLY